MSREIFSCGLPGGLCTGLAAILSVCLLACPARAQPATYDLRTRTGNIESPILAPPGEMSLYYTHRFSGGLTAIANAPTFILGTSVLPWLGVDFVYATKATVISPAGSPVIGAHDVGLTFRQEILREGDGAPVGLALTQGVFSAGLAPDPKVSAGISTNAVGGGVGLTVGRKIGPLGLVGAVRGVGLSHAVINNQIYPGGAFGRINAGLGATYAISPHLALAGDWSKFVDGPLEVPAWSASLQGEIPFTPHLLTFEVTNVPAITMGGSVQPVNDLFYGFNFAIRFRGLDRWISMVAPPPPPEPEVSEEPAHPVAVPAAPAPAADSSGMVPPGPSTPGATPSEAALAQAPESSASAQAAAAAPPRAPASVTVLVKDFVYKPATVTVAPGTVVVWINRDPVAHTSTATNKKWDTGSYEQNASGSVRFDKPGTYPYICTPHPFMKGTVIVREEPNRESR